MDNKSTHFHQWIEKGGTEKQEFCSDFIKEEFKKKIVQLELKLNPKTGLDHHI